VADAENLRNPAAEAFGRGYSVLSTFERYQRIAPVYDLIDLPFEYGRYRRIRRLLFEGLSGRLLDAGVGTGRNFPFYPPGSAVVGIDISPAMLAWAGRRRKSAPAEIELRQMDVTRLNFADQTFDGAVATFLFCVLPDSCRCWAERMGPSCEGGRARSPVGVRATPTYRPAGSRSAVGALDRLGLWREFRPPNGGACSRGRPGAR